MKTNNCNNDFGLLDNSEIYSDDVDDYDDNGKHRKFSVLSKRRQYYEYDDDDTTIVLLLFPDSGFLSPNDH